jgi:fructokinase
MGQMNAAGQTIVVGIGEVLWDMLPEGKRLGGAPANFAYHAHALGGRAITVSSVGQDDSGREILQQLTGHGMNTEYIQTNSLPTGCVEVKICNNGHPAYVIHENVAWDHIQFTPAARELAGKCDAVCFGTLAQRNPVSRKSIQDFLAHTKNHCLRIFDINLRQQYFSREIIEESLLAATILKLNDEELAVLQEMFGWTGSVESALAMLLDRFQLDFAALTSGARGSIMMDRENVYHCLGTPVTVKDTIGAGDAFTATMVMGKLYGLPLEQINRLAGKVAAYVCSQAGATPTLSAYLIAELNQELPIPIREIADRPAQKTQHYGLDKQ